MCTALRDTLVESRPGESATFTNPVPECSLICLGKLLERGVTTVGPISALVSACFDDDGAALAKRATSSKEW